MPNFQRWVSDNASSTARPVATTTQEKLEKGRKERLARKAKLARESRKRKKQYVQNLEKANAVLMIRIKELKEKLRRYEEQEKADLPSSSPPSRLANLEVDLTKLLTTKRIRTEEQTAKILQKCDEFVRWFQEAKRFRNEALARFSPSEQEYASYETLRNPALIVEMRDYLSLTPDQCKLLHQFTGDIHENDRENIPIAHLKQAQEILKRYVTRRMHAMEKILMVLDKSQLARFIIWSPTIRKNTN